MFENKGTNKPEQVRTYMYIMYTHCNNIIAPLSRRGIHMYSASFICGVISGGHASPPPPPPVNFSTRGLPPLNVKSCNDYYSLLLSHSSQLLCIITVTGASTILEGECSAAENGQGQGGEREGGGKTERAGARGKREARGGGEIEDFIERQQPQGRTSGRQWEC